MVESLGCLTVPVLWGTTHSAGASLGLRLLWEAAGPWSHGGGLVLNGGALRHWCIHCRSVARHQSQLIILRQGSLGNYTEVMIRSSVWGPVKSIAQNSKLRLIKNNLQKKVRTRSYFGNARNDDGALLHRWLEFLLGRLMQLSDCSLCHWIGAIEHQQLGVRGRQGLADCRAQGRHLLRHPTPCRLRQGVRCFLGGN